MSDEKMKDMLLPIGSVVFLQGTTKKMMIVGYKTAKEENPKAVYDYVGVLFPEGYINETYKFLFNKSDINDIAFTGFEGEEFKKFNNFLEDTYRD